MKEISKNGLFMFLRMFIVVIMCAIVTVSISFLCTAAFTHNKGYRAFVYDDKNVKVDEYTYYYADGDDTKEAEYNSLGYTVNKSYERTELKGKGYVIYNVSCQIIGIIITFVFIYNAMFNLGNKDLNLVRTGHKTEDKLKGLKIGLIASIPNFILFFAVLICGLGVNKSLPIALFTLPNFHVYQFLRLIAGKATLAGELAIYKYALMFLVTLVVPAISHISYTLGYKDVFVIEKIVYKNTKKKR